jgi:hypothetical protein
MTSTIRSVLDNPLIRVVKRDDQSGYYCLKLGVLETEIEIWLNVRPESRFTEFTQSHALKTPIQDAPYWTSRPWNDDPAAALHQALGGLTQQYEWAIDGGYPPSEDWLVLFNGAKV